MFVDCLYATNAVENINSCFRKVTKSSMKESTQEFSPGTAESKPPDAPSNATQSVHTHSYSTPIYKNAHHDAEYKTVHHDAVYEDQSYDVVICGCGAEKSV